MSVCFKIDFTKLNQSMQEGSSEQHSNLLILQQPKEHKHQRIAYYNNSSQGQHSSRKISSSFMSFGIYAVLILLVCIISYDIQHLLLDSPSYLLPKNHQDVALEVQEDDQMGESLKKRDQQGKRKHSLTQSQIRKLRIIQLQREMMKINKAIRSKQEYDENLILSQLDKNTNKLKYWNFDQENIQKQPKPQTTVEEDSTYINKIVPPQDKNHFPKIVWMYVQENISAESNLTQILIGNLAEYFELQGYDFYLIGEYNFRYLMSNRHQEQLGFVLVDLWHLAYETNSTTNLKDHTFTIKKHLISLIMLSQMGGILIDKDMILTQPLDWLQDFMSIKLANRGRSLEAPNIIGFYHANYTDSLEQIEMENGQRKQVHLYPPLDPYFLAVSKEGKAFISQVLQRYYVLLEFPNRIKEIIVKYQLSLKELTGNDPYYQAIYFAFSWVLKRKQIQLQEPWIEGEKRSLRPLALDYYRIYAINRVYGPLKYRFLFSEVDHEDIYQYLSKISYDALSMQFGSISYMSFIPFAYKIEQFAAMGEGGSKGLQIYKQSFLGKHVYKNVSESWISQKDPLKKTPWIQYGTVWNNLPRKIWIYSQERSLIRQLCINNVLFSASASKFQVILITPQNLKDYLPQALFMNMQQAFNMMKLNMNGTTIPNVWIEIVKLAILKQHGGVWLQMPLFTLQDFDWILEIHHNMQTLNRVGRLPKILLFYHSIQNGFPYKCQKKCSIKDISSFSTAFIATEPGTDIINTWLKQMLANIMLQEYQFINKLSQFNISYKQIKDGSQLSKITFHSILAGRNKRFGELSKHRNWALQQFGIWGLNSFTGLDKLKQYTNFDVGFNANNIYLWSLSADKLYSLLGNFQYLVHLSSQSQRFLNRQMLRISQFHIDPDSLFSLHVMDYTLLEELLKNSTMNALELFKKATFKKQK